mgnify:CR=1 FL=1
MRGTQSMRRPIWHALLVRPRHPEEKEFFLNFNGITNCIQPLWRLTCEGEHRTLPRILRSLYRDGEEAA